MAEAQAPPRLQMKSLPIINADITPAAWNAHIGRLSLNFLVEGLPDNAANFDQVDEKEQNDLEPSPEIYMKISNLVNEINDFAVGVLQAEIKSSEERIGCK